LANHNASEWIFLKNFILILKSKFYMHWREKITFKMIKLATTENAFEKK